MDIRIKKIKGHYEVYDSRGRFLFSADNMAEVEDGLLDWQGR